MNETDALREVKRCRRDIARGGSASFWFTRLTDAIARVERVLTILRAARTEAWDAHIKQEAKETPNPW